MNYIVDTRTLVWYFVKDDRLSNRVKQIIQEAEQGRNELVIPVIVLTKDPEIKKATQTLW